MPRTQLTAGAHRENWQVDRFEALKLDRGESHRIWIPNEDFAWMELRHNVKAPVFADDGSPLQMERKRGGQVKLVYDMENGFIGAPICLGKPEVIADQKLDWDSCPACAGVKRLLDAGIGDALDLGPQMRYAVPVIRYTPVSKTDPSKGLRRPPNAEILVWALSQWSWEKVDKVRAKMAELLDVSDLTQVKLQDCDIQVSNENGYQKIDDIDAKRLAKEHNSDFGRELKALVDALWDAEENRPTEDQLQAACGRKTDPEYMDRDIRDAEERWHQAENHGKGGVTDRAAGGYLANGQPAASLDEGLDLLDGGPGDEDLTGHPGGVAEFADPATQAALAAADDGDILGSAPEPAQPSPAASAPADDDDPFGTVTVPPRRQPATAGSSGPRGATRSFTEIIDGAK